MMGLFGDVLGTSAKAKLVRQLLAYRIGDPPPMSGPAVMSLPEATVVNVIEAYGKCRAQGADHGGALAAIERHRRRIGAARLQDDTTLTQYIAMRLDIEHPQAFSAGFSTKHLQMCIAFAQVTLGVAYRDDGTAPPPTTAGRQVHILPPPIEDG